MDSRIAVSSVDPLAADVLSARLMGFDAKKILYLSPCRGRNGPGQPGKIKVLGNPAADSYRFQEFAAAEILGGARSVARRSGRSRRNSGEQEHRAGLSGHHRAPIPGNRLTPAAVRPLGSMRAILRAGSQLASKAAPNSTMATQPKIVGSFGRTW